MPDSASVGEVRDPVWLSPVEGLRGIAFVFIVFGHAGALLADIPHSDASMAIFAVLLALSRFALPAFMLLSSLLIAWNKSRDKTWRLTPGLIRLTTSYVLWTTIYVVLAKLIAGTGPMQLRVLAGDILRAVVSGTGMYHLWYIMIALQIYVVAPLLTSVLMGRTTLTLSLVAGVAIAGNVVLLGQIGGPLLERGGVLAWTFGSAADRLALFWIAYITVGVVIGLEYRPFMDRLRRLRPAVISMYVALAAAVSYMVAEYALLVQGDYQASADISRIMQPWILPFELLSILAWLLIADSLMNTRLAKPLGVLAAYSFGGYLLHPLVLSFGRQYVFGLPALPPTLVLVALLFVFTLFVTMASVWLLSRIETPLGLALVGPRAKRSAPPTAK